MYISYSLKDYIPIKDTLWEYDSLAGNIPDAEIHVLLIQFHTPKTSGPIHMQLFKHWIMLFKVLLEMLLDFKSSDGLWLSTPSSQE